MSRCLSQALTLLFLAMIVSTSSGCAVMMAAKAPERVDMRVLSLGEPRGRVVSELGAPIQSRDEVVGGTDVFAFKQGYPLSERAARTALHGVADVFTLGLWELVGTPLESSLQGEQVRVQVEYDESDRVRRIEYYEGAHLAGNRRALAGWLRGKGAQQTAVIEKFSNPAPLLPSDVSHAGYQAPPAGLQPAIESQPPDGLPPPAPPGGLKF